MKYLFLYIFLHFVLLNSGFCQSPRPSIYQKLWHDMEFYLFIHFGPNTFTNVEWGHGDEDKNVFNPTALNCNQWCQTAVAAGAKGIIITAKHHDGFCLWPSKYSSHTVAASKWKDGKGDILKSLSEACAAHGLKFGVYISPWDRNHPTYGTDEYNNIFINMMEEIFDNYGPIWELWWDGANGEGPNGKKQVYDWERFIAFVRKKSPSTVIFSDVGPDIRWVGNEKGYAGITNWNNLNTDGYSPGLGGPPVSVLNSGNKNGKNWIPAECDVSIRPGWFYHATEDVYVKSDTVLFDLYLKSVGRGSNLLLNVPPDTRGLIHQNDSLALMGFKKMLEDNFRQDLIANKKAIIAERKEIKESTAITDNNNDTSEKFSQKKKGSISINLNLPIEVNCISISEDITDGQLISKWEIQILHKNIKIKSIKGTTIGKKRILTFPSVKGDTIRLKILESQGIASISNISAFQMNERLLKSINTIDEPTKKSKNK